METEYKKMPVDNFIATIRAANPDKSLNLSDDQVFNQFATEYPNHPQMAELSGLSIPQMATIIRQSNEVGNMSDFSTVKGFLEKYPDRHDLLSMKEKAKLGIAKVSEWLPTAGAVAGGLASGLAAPGTAGASLLGGSALAGLGAAAGKAGEQIVKRAVGDESPDTSYEAFKDIGVEGISTAAINAIGGKVLKAVEPAAKGMAKQVLRGFARLDERLTGKVLNDPSILSRAKPLAEAKKDFSKFFEDNGFIYGRPAIKEATGKRKLGADGVDNLVNKVLDDIEKVGIKSKPKREGQIIQEALAARYSTKDAIKTAIRSGADEDARYFTNAKNQIDDWLETKIPGFSGIRKEYEEAKIKEAFSPIFPLNKNKESSVLGVMTTIGATLGAGALGPVYATGAAIATSPKLAGLAIQGASKISGPALGAAASEIGAKGVQKIIPMVHNQEPK